MQDSTIGRNDPCPCGSGEKYKKCCITAVFHSDLIHPTWRKLREAEGVLIDDHLFPYAKNKLPTLSNFSLRH